MIWLSKNKTSPDRSSSWPIDDDDDDIKYDMIWILWFIQIILKIMSYLKKKQDSHLVIVIRLLLSRLYLQSLISFSRQYWKAVKTSLETVYVLSVWLRISELISIFLCRLILLQPQQVGLVLGTNKVWL